MTLWYATTRIIVYANVCVCMWLDIPSVAADVGKSVLPDSHRWLLACALKMAEPRQVRMAFFVAVKRSFSRGSGPNALATQAESSDILAASKGDAHEVATAMENPDVDVFEVRDITDIGSASERYGSGKELRALVDEVPDAISAEGKSSEVDSFRISNFGALKKIVEKGES